ncbi:MAG TPA: hypothetical protein VMK12_18060 [Anaeromyxobacteraceae bacterium]|nr:hypothetical protein [Anaeromyxobacteraceae bacterium]
MTAFGSLATLLSRARASRVDVPGKGLLLVGVAVTPLLLVAAWVGLALLL